MVAFYSALLAVVLCGTISAAEKVEKERVSSLSFSGAENRKRGLYVGLVKSQEGNILSRAYVEECSNFFDETKFVKSQRGNVSGKVRVNKIMLRFFNQNRVGKEKERVGLFQIIAVYLMGIVLQ